MSSSLSYAVLQSESSWGTADVAAINHYLPLTAFGLKADVETREQQPACGVLHVGHSEKFRRSCRGPIACPLYGQFTPTAMKSFAQYLIEWAFSPVAVEHDPRPSKSLHWFDDVSAALWDGLRVDEATLSGDASGISLSLNLIGRAESESILIPTLPANRAKLAEFLFSELAFVFDGVPLAIDSFAWTVKHSLTLKHNGDYTPSSLRSMVRNESLTIRPLKTDDTITALQRLDTMAEKVASLTMSGLHDGTGASGTKTQVALAFPRLAIQNANDIISFGDYNWQPIVMTVLKPQTIAKAVGQTWSLI